MQLDDARPIERTPHRNLLLYYLLRSLLVGPFFVIPMVPFYFRFHTLRYVFDAEGVSMRWGILFRREISLTYARIQDIHLVSNFVERWLGLARIQIQTASGSANAEMIVEGLQDFERIRDLLYSRMRGVREDADDGAASPERVPPGLDGLGQVTAALIAAADEIKALREELERRRRA